jgi:hypothetical protein
MTYLEELARELTAHGITGRTRRRILLEADDHLRSDAEAQQRFGSAREVANAFAGELGAQVSRRAAVSAFAALGVAGAVYAALFASLSFAGSPSETLDPPLGALAFAVIIVAPQISFVAGLLALLRALRRRHERIIPTRELIVIRRRTGVALLFGLVTMAALSLYASEFTPLSPGGGSRSPMHRLPAPPSCSPWPPFRHSPRPVSDRRLQAQPETSSRTSASGASATILGASRASSRSPSARSSGSPAWCRATRSTASFAVSSKDSPASEGSPCSGGTSGSVASIDACPLPHPSATSRT